jgi:hypothetical protein
MQQWKMLLQASLILPLVQGDLDYHTIHSIRKLLRANARSVETHLGGGYHGHLISIVSIAAYAVIAHARLWVNSTAPGRAPT